MNTQPSPSEFNREENEGSIYISDIIFLHHSPYLKLIFENSPLSFIFNNLWYKVPMDSNVNKEALKEMEEEKTKFSPLNLSHLCSISK